MADIEDVEDRMRMGGRSQDGGEQVGGPHGERVQEGGEGAGPGEWAGVATTLAEQVVGRMASLASPFLAKEVEYAMNGGNAEKFLRDYERSFSQHFTTAETFCRCLQKEVPHRFMQVIEEWEEYKSGDWAGVKEKMIQEYGEGDDDDSPDLSDFYDVIYRQLKGKHRLQTRNDLQDYYRRFKRHSEPLVKKEILSWQTESSLFLEGLPKDIVQEYYGIAKRSIKDDMEPRPKTRETRDGRERRESD
ncbi:BQ5605_C039g11781 [Microbotryum silenes-dioicae]|uniref:BQ5605_C039g11781 protein n=1 Tax=Microbotryum silenes-dioicae TaxID=796604 RepID=A0A2X0MEA1_9BASI|nr:BQ5605_C039g11781 [Microbotryum silenes-dioicae]